MMTIPTLTSRIDHIRQLLTSAIDIKLQRDHKHGHTQALTDLQDAYDLAREEPLLPTPWPEITSYRLAHLRMRKASNKEELKDIEKLFAEISAKNRLTLGILPNIYQLAIRMRLGEDCAELFAETVCLLDQPNPFLNTPKKLEHTPVLNNQIVNYLELLAYVGGFDYCNLEGRYSYDDPFKDLGLGGGFIVKSNFVELPDIQMPLSLALAQAFELAGDDGLVLSWVTSNLTDFHCYQHSKQTPEPKALNRAWSLLLREMIAEGKLYKRELQPDDTRKHLERMNTFLAKKLNVDKKTIFDDAGIEKKLSSELKVFGVFFKERKKSVTTSSQQN